MTMPDDGTHVLLGQILAKQTEIVVQLAVITEQLRPIPDHEQRIRTLEKARWPVPTISAIGAVGAGAAAWFAAVHH
jgi:hypothetical protein